MKNKFINIWKFVAGGATVIAYDSWYDILKNKKASADMLSKMDNMTTSLNELSEKINNCMDPVLKAKLKVHQMSIRESLNNLSNIQQKYLELYAQKSENPKGLFAEYTEEFSAAFNQVLEKAAEMDKSLSISDSIVSSTKFIDDNIIWDKLNEFQTFVSTLSITELCFLMNILMSIFIFTCLISILFAFYGNFLIEKFSLEKKYPKLSSIIRLRVKLQHYYIIINTLLIVLGLIFIVFINVMTFVFG